MSHTSDENRFLNDISFANIQQEQELGYYDRYVTKQQQQRDEQITILLTEYVKSYQTKVNQSKKNRHYIFVSCMGIVVVFAISLFIFAIYIIIVQPEVSHTDLIAFITACISFISLIIGLLTIVTKYFFPQNDEQYITTIVESIQKNDLENKRENAKHASEEFEATEIRER